MKLAKRIGMKKVAIARKIAVILHRIWHAADSRRSLRVGRLSF
jgi:hypothetical protein